MIELHLGRAIDWVTVIWERGSYIWVTSKSVLNGYKWGGGGGGGKKIKK